MCVIKQATVIYNMTDNASKINVLGLDRCGGGGGGGGGGIGLLSQT